MRNFTIVAALVICLIVPALAAEAPTALEAKVNALESNNAALTEDLGNTRLDLDKTKTDMLARFAAEIKAREAGDKALSDSMTKLQSDLTAEVTARTASDKQTATQIADLQTKLTDQALTIAKLQSDLDAEKTARAKEDAQLAATIAHNYKVAKTNRTIGYGLDAILAGFAFSHH